MAFRTLIGRSRELADLEAALARAIAGQGGTFLLCGEPGIGKTRLAEEIAERAQQKGASVFWGRAWEVEGAPACWPWVQILRACAPSDEGELGPLLARQPAARTEGESEPDLLRLGFAIVALLERLSRKGPLVLVFDDLHASDVASLNLLEVVARELRRLGVLVVATYRETEARRVPTVASLLARLGREGNVRPLGPLDRSEVAEWVAMALGSSPSDALAVAVFDATEGNPLFVDALSQLLASRGHGALPQAGVALPDTIRETVQELLARLSPGARAVLDAAAVLGRECAATTLQRVSDASSADVLAAVGEGVEAGVLSAQPPRVVRFAHVLIRETIYQALPAARRIGLHASAVRALTHLPAADREEHLAELAHHSFESGSWLAAADYASRAGHRAESLLAFDAAAKHFERALSAFEHAQSHDDAQRADWLWRLGLSQIRMGQSRPGKDACARAATLAMQCGEHETQARAALAYGSEFMYGYSDPRLVALLESVLASPLRNDALRARAMARLAAAMMPTEFPERPIHLRAEAIATARALGDRRVLADVLFGARAAFSPVDDLDERTAL
ncbi:MAG TPA: AAA family ATPase, partial [Polyangiaceae bacterium]|nr:AAA family ATPase [Polyangiaceae bacterium]